MPNRGFSWNLFADIQDLFHYHFMQNALLAGTIVAIVAGIVGYFMVLRSESFAGHTLANVGFAGASGATLIGIAPVAGLLVFSLLAAIGIGALGERSVRSHSRSDVAIGTILAVALGLGLLFDRLSSLSADSVYAVLFGSVFGVTDRDMVIIAGAGAVTLVGLAVIARPLLFASVDPEAATARGVPVRTLGSVFLILLALAVAEAVQVVGVLLIFALLVTPVATAGQLTARPMTATLEAVAIALVVTWVGLAVAYYTPYPAGFYITSLAFGLYLLVRLTRALRRWRSESLLRGPAPDDESTAIGTEAGVAS